LKNLFKEKLRMKIFSFEICDTSSFYLSTSVLSRFFTPGGRIHLSGSQAETTKSVIEPIILMVSIVSLVDVELNVNSELLLVSVSLVIDLLSMD
jgi:hypothetical protein